MAFHQNTKVLSIIVFMISKCTESRSLCKISLFFSVLLYFRLHTKIKLWCHKKIYRLCDFPREQSKISWEGDSDSRSTEKRRNKISFSHQKKFATLCAVHINRSSPNETQQNVPAIVVKRDLTWLTDDLDGDFDCFSFSLLAAAALDIFLREIHESTMMRVKVMW